MKAGLSSNRRGVLLLLVLGLLALFALVAVAFVIISGQSQRSSRITQRVDQTQNDPQRQLNEAMMQVARGPSNFASAMGPHSLLEDVYGNTSVYAQITSAAPVAGGQLIEFTYLVASPNMPYPTNTPAWVSDSISDSQHRLGCVATFLDLPLMGESTRIVGRNPTNGNFQLLATGSISMGNIASGMRILINGIPFSGTGFGFNPATGKLDLAYVLDPNNTTAAYQQWLTTSPSSPPLTSTATKFNAALLPNMPLIAYQTSPDALISGAPGGIPGGANEDYDAADYQNMLLGAQITDATGHVTGVIPSMHRPAMVNYWYNDLANDPSGKGYEGTFWNSTGLSSNQKISALQSPLSISDPIALQNVINFKRRIIMRPLPESNPDFSGSNPSVTPTNPWNPIVGPWDVDNDGDGVADSIWVDLGFPVRAAKNGKLYKPLFAILCLDMDGRLNLNAHGDLEQAKSSYYGGTDLPVDAGDVTYAANNFAGSVVPPITRGRGFGPAEINLNAIFPVAASSIYQQLLTGNGIYEGRYGSDGVPGSVGTPYFSEIGLATPPPVDSSRRAYNDYLSANKWFEFDGLYSNSWSKQAPTAMQSDPTKFFKVNGELPDPQGKSALGVDPAGRPILQSLSGSTFMDLPYELNLGRKTARGLPGTPISGAVPDNPFSVGELERILRPFDRDAASLPARLAALTFDPSQNQSALINKRQEVTTDSWDLPVFSPGLPPHILTRVQSDLAAGNVTASAISWLPARNVTDLLKAYYYYQLVAIGGVAPATAVPQAETAVNTMSYRQLTALFPPEMLAGLKMNINHPFPGPGTGASSDSNGFGMAAVWQSLGAGGSYGDFWFGQMPDYPDGTYDPNGATTPNPNGAPFAARQRYARYLYVLAMLLCDRDPATNRLIQAQWFHPPEDTSLTLDEKEQLTKRRIAQWAINAACFKVNDSVMVPFEYDLNPFDNDDPSLVTNPNKDTWNVDGRIGTTANPSADDTYTYRGLVWGCKPPELILTETLAFHDRRIADTAWDDATHTRVNITDPTKDHDFDQTRVPQGSAFFELYCPRDFHGSAPPPDLYDTATNKLDLGRLAPADGNGRQYPVWRLVIGASNIVNTQNNAASRFGSNTDTFLPQPQQYLDAPAYLQYAQTNDETSLLPKTISATTQITIDRIVWFANLQPVTKLVDSSRYHADADRIYYNYAGTPTLLDRGHYAVIGPRATTILGLISDTDANYPYGKPAPQRISIPAPNSPQVTDITGTPDANIDSTKIKLPLGIIVGNTPNGWSMQVGISISEPLFSSGSYYTQPTVTGPDGIKEWYGDWKRANPDRATNGGYFLDTPLDKDPSRPLGSPSENLPYAGVAPNYKTVFLQRLANPSAPYDPATNPYLTVDWIPIDLRIFNGEEDPPVDDPDIRVNPNPDTTTDNAPFATRQRGKGSPSPTFNIWKPESDDPNTAAEPISPGIYFDHNLGHSLGYLNKAFQPFITSASGKPPELYGDPLTQPFPWLPWFGRPYVDQLELMLVPASHPARLLWEFQPCTSGLTNNYVPGDITQAPFPQLLNFLQTQNTGASQNLNQFGRILDYVGVPSWFAGTEIQANPSMISPAGTPASPGSHTFFPPYNKISTYREPGRINLNTIYSADVFNGLMNGNGSPTWDTFKQNRRGYSTATNNVLDIDPKNQFPTEFGSPFRTCGGGSLVPELDDKTGSGGTAGPLGSDYLKPKYEIDASYMRQDSTTPANPLFQFASASPVNNTDRNPFFHYQGLERLGNLVTTRSNVYSVWITVGYFEVKPNRVTTPPGLPDAAHPDGYELGQEMGSDTGEIVRHRAFYMIDRTIPVGFQRGQDMNVEKAIILKRFIE